MKWWVMSADSNNHEDNAQKGEVVGADGTETPRSEIVVPQSEKSEADSNFAEVLHLLSEPGDEATAEAANIVHGLDDVESKAELINRLPDSRREQLVHALDEAHVFDSDILPHLDADATDDVVAALSGTTAAEAITQLDTEDAVQIIADLDDDDQQEILDNIDAAKRHELEEGLSYPEESAGRLMRKNMVVVPEFWTVGDTIDYLRSNDNLPDDFYVVFVVDPKFVPVGELLLAKIMSHKRAVLIKDIMNSKIHAQNTHTDQEDVAFDFRKYALVEAPVVGENGKLVGTITVDDVVDVMQEEIEEDFLRAGGVSEQDIQDSVMSAVSKRFPWLFVNLLTAIAASVIIDLYSETIEQLVLLAVLMPIVASMGGNAGIQSSTVAVRAIATRRIPTGRVFAMLRKEMALGAVNGAGIAIVMAVGIYMLYGDLPTRNTCGI